MQNISIKIFDFDGFFEAVYGCGGMPIDESIFNRIRYMNTYDFGYEQKHSVKPYFVVLFEGNKIIGVSKQGYYSLSAPNKNTLSIAYLSIDKDYREKGYARLMVNEVFAEAKRRGIEIQTSSYSFMGKQRLKALFNEYAVKHCVVFYDKKETDYLADSETEYTQHNGKLVHKRELE